MSNLLDTVIEAHGGSGQWSKVSRITAQASIGGAMWGLKGKGGLLDKETIDIDSKRQHVVYTPFGTPERQSVFTPDWNAIQSTSGEVVEERTRPREFFKGHVLQTPWDDLNVVYFSGYAMWGYLTAPFHFLMPGITTEEIQPWQEGDQTWRQLKVSYPSAMAVHSAEQTFYFDKSGLMRRVDYNVDIAGNVPSAHYMDDHKSFGGIIFPTRRRVHPRMPDGTPKRERTGVSIDVTDIDLS